MRKEQQFAPPLSKKQAERQLIFAAQAGETEALGQLLESYRSRITNVLTKMLSDESLAEDLFQSTCERVALHIASYKRNYEFSTWIYTIALNLARNVLRIRKKVKLEPIEDYVLELSTERKTSVPPVDVDELRRHLEHLRKQLPSKYREAYTYRDIMELEYEEVANRLGIPLGTVKSRVNRARQIMRERLQHSCPELLKRFGIPAP